MICSLGADITHPPPGATDRPSFTSVVGSVDGKGGKYVSRIGVQSSPRELIEDMENMCVVSTLSCHIDKKSVITYWIQDVFEQYRREMGRLPNRILFYRG